VKINILLATALLIASAAGASTNESTHTTQPFGGTTVNPCTGEPIQYFGTCHLMAKESTDRDGAVSTRTHMLCEAHGITPDFQIHRFLTGGTEVVDTSTGCGFEQKIRQTVKVISTGVRPNFFLETLVHLRINESCETEILSIESNPECRGADQ
jgi:hypothetical protein